MTEAEWLACGDPTPMLDFLQDRPGDRKLRLFGCGCCRRIWHLLTDERSRGGVEAAERFADGEAGEDELREHGAAAWNAADRSMGRLAAAREAAAEVTAERDAFGFVYHLQLLVYNAFYAVGESRAEYAGQCQLLRDIFGNPFRPISFSSSWQTNTALALARQMYESRDFSAMPILADALQDAGCDSEDVLDHCRSGGPHVRGCWVIDLLLGKE